MDLMPFKDPIKQKEYMKRYNQEHNELIKQQQKLRNVKCYQNRKEEIKQQSKKYRKEHPEVNRKSSRKWKKNNKDKVNFFSRIHKFAERHNPLGLYCELCPEDDKRTENLERHHPDYDYPEIIVTVCKECHEGI